MGNICNNEHKDPTVYQRGSRPITSIIRTYLGYSDDSENQKIQEIKQFLTLTSQNAQSFYDADHCQINQGTEPQKSQPRSITDFVVVRGLGKGAFGQVFLVKDKQKSNSFLKAEKCYAMKIINKDRITTEQQKIHTLSERYILQAMDNPFIVKLHYAFQTHKKLYLLVDLMAGGQLFYLLRRNKKFPQNVAKFYAAEILIALNYIHKRNIIYRDLKPENILIDREGHLKLTDFGLSKVCFSRNQLAYSMCGTPEYIAPEIIQGKGYSQSADWFSYGSLIYDMLTGKPPFYSKNKHQILKNVTSKSVPIPEFLSPEAKSLLKQLFRIKPKDRLGSKNGAEDIMKHKFFEDINFEEVEKKVIKPPITFKQTELNEEGFDENLVDALVSSAYDEKTMKGAYGFDGFTYLKHEIMSVPKEQKPNTNILNQIEE